MAACVTCNHNGSRVSFEFGFEYELELEFDFELDRTCLVPVGRFPRPSWSIHLVDVSERKDGKRLDKKECACVRCF